MRSAWAWAWLHTMDAMRSRSGPSHRQSQARFLRPTSPSGTRSYLLLRPILRATPLRERHRTVRHLHYFHYRGARAKAVCQTPTRKRAAQGRCRDSGALRVRAEVRSVGQALTLRREHRAKGRRRTSAGVDGRAGEWSFVSSIFLKCVSRVLQEAFPRTMRLVRVTLLFPSWACGLV